MYDDPSHIRDREIKVRLNDEELAVVDALARYNRRQRAAFIRELVMASVARFEAQVTEQPKAA
ncbi:ribbon-helix-helix protein, CopG family [Rhodanobacter sp. BL-MT-08]